MIYAPIIMNAEVICYKGEWENVKEVGVNQGREQEKTLAKKTYPQIEKFQDITQKAILYMLEDEQVDGIIQDITKAAGISEYPSVPLTLEDQVSYVMVVNKEFAETEAFTDFVNSYNKAVEKMNDLSYLSEKLNADEEWLKEKNIKFLTISER